MSSRIQLDPAQLDRIEDALEGLEDLPIEQLDELDQDDAVGRELLEFRELLQLSREAMPLEEVPAGLLDGVLDEARQAAAQVAPIARESWWSRLKMGVWVPTVAFAGSAALLLIMLWPAADEDAARGDAVARVEPEAPLPAATPAEGEDQRRLADASFDGAPKDAVEDPFGPGEAARGGGAAIGTRETVVEEPAEVAAAEEDAPPPPPSPSPVAKPKPKRAKSSGSSKSKTATGKGPLGGVYDEPKSSPPGSGSGSKGNKKIDSSPDLMREVLEGDKARKAGNCGLAKMRYDKVARESEDRHERARALAGKGLCEAAAGNSTKAKKLFDQARAADPGVDGFIRAGLSALDGAPGEPANAAEQSDQAQTKD